MKQVFVSYSSHNDSIANKLIKDIEGQGISCWIAPRDIAPGETWAASIMNAISKSRVMILLLSEASDDSVQVIREVEQAVNLRIPIIPIRLSAHEPSDAMRYFISSHQWLDAYKESYDQWSLALYQRLTRIDTANSIDTDKSYIEKQQSKNKRNYGSLALKAIALISVLALVIVGFSNSSILGGGDDEASLNKPESISSDSSDAFALQAMQLEDIALEQIDSPDLAASALFDAGEAYINAQDFENSIRVFTFLADEYPDYSQSSIGLFRIADELVNLERFIEAGNLYSKGCELPSYDSQDVSYVISAANAYELGGADALAVNTILTFFQVSTELSSDMLQASSESTYDMLMIYDWLYNFLLSHEDYYESREITFNLLLRLRYATDSDSESFEGIIKKVTLDEQILEAYQTLLLNLADLYVERFVRDSTIVYTEVYLVAEVYYYNASELQRAGDLYRNVGNLSDVEFAESALINSCSSYGQAFESATSSSDSLLILQKMHQVVLEYKSSFPDGQYVAQLLYSVAGYYFNFDLISESRALYLEVIENYPESEYCGRAARYIASSYEAEEDFLNSSEWYLVADSIFLISNEQYEGVSSHELAVASDYSYAESAVNDNLRKSARLFEDLAFRYPESEIAPMSLFDSAEAYTTMEDYENAHRVFSLLIEEYPDHRLAIESLARRAYLYGKNGQHQLAAELYLDAYNESEPDIALLFLYSAANAYKNAGAIDDATELYLGIIDRNSSYGINSLSAVAEFAINEGRYYDASNHYADAITAHSTFIPGLSYTFRNFLKLLSVGYLEGSIKLVNVFYWQYLSLT